MIEIVVYKNAKTSIADYTYFCKLIKRLSVKTNLKKLETSLLPNSEFGVFLYFLFFEVALLRICVLLKQVDSPSAARIKHLHFQDLLVFEEYPICEELNAHFL